MAERVAAALRAELEETAPDVWPRVRRTVASRVVAQLLVELDRPPSPHSRLGWELRARVRESIPLRKVA